MRIPKTPVEFDYDLWTTEDGKCMVRVKATGETTEVDREVMKLLRAEEKKLRRSFASLDDKSDETGIKQFLSLDEVSEEDVNCSAWLSDDKDFTNAIMAKSLESEFLRILTPRQRDIYHKCLLHGVSRTNYAKENGISVARVSRAIADIRESAKKFFEKI